MTLLASVTTVRYSVSWFDAALFGLFPVVVFLILFVRRRAKQQRDAEWEVYDEDGDLIDDVEIEEPPEVDSVDEIDEDYDTDVRRW